MEKTKVVFFWSGINSKTLKKTRFLTPQHVRETKRLQILTHHGRPLKKSRFNMVGMVSGPHESHPSTWQLFSRLYIDREIHRDERWIDARYLSRYRYLDISLDLSY